MKDMLKKRNIMLKYERYFKNEKYCKNMKDMLKKRNIMLKY